MFWKAAKVKLPFVYKLHLMSNLENMADEVSFCVLRCYIRSSLNGFYITSVICQELKLENTSLVRKDVVGDGVVSRVCGLDCCTGVVLLLFLCLVYRFGVCKLKNASLVVLQETQIKKLKHSLHDWKEILLAIKSVLLWDQQWYPGAIVGGKHHFVF